MANKGKGSGNGFARDMPTRVYAAKTFNVKTHDCVEVDIDVGWQTSVRRRVLVEGVDRFTIPDADRDAAMHCMVVLLGGRNLIVETDQADVCDRDIPLARLFVDVFPDVLPAGTPGVATPYGMARQALEVGQFFAHVRARGYNPGDVVAVFGAARAARRSARDEGGGGDGRQPRDVPTPEEQQRHRQGGNGGGGGGGCRRRHDGVRRPDRAPAKVAPAGQSLAERIRDGLRGGLDA